MAIERSNLHIDEELLESYALGRLDENQSAPLEEHLLTCHSCQDQLESVDNFIHTFRAAARVLESEEPLAERIPWYKRIWQMPRIWVPALAAAAMLALFVRMPDATYPTQSAKLEAYRSADTNVTVTAGSTLNLELDAVGLPTGRPFRAEVVRLDGTKVWYGAAGWKSGQVSVFVPKPLQSGQYWVRIYDADPESEPLREYGLNVK